MANLKIVKDTEVISEFLIELFESLAHKEGYQPEDLHVDGHELFKRSYFGDIEMQLFDNPHGHIDSFMFRFQKRNSNTYLLEFGIGGQMWSKVASDNGDLFLLRSASKDNKNDSLKKDWFESVEVEGDKYFKIACGKNTAQENHISISYFLALHLRGRGSKNKVIDGTSSEHGPSRAQERKGCTTIPKHHPVAIRAEEYFIKEKFEILEPINSRPDFKVKKDGRIFVVEVKPDDHRQSLCSAMGQLAFYKELETADGEKLVLPKFCEGEKNVVLFKKLKKDTDIIFV